MDVMEGRLKVADFHRQPTTNCAIPLPSLSKAFFQDGELLVTCTDRPQTLLRYSLSSRSQFMSIELPIPNIKAVAVSQGQLCCIFEGNEDLWVLIGTNLVPLKSHFTPLTAISPYEDKIITGSKDRTLRVWVHEGNKLVPERKLHVLAAHTETIVCLLEAQPFLFSSAEDKWLLVWRGVKVWARKKFESVVKGIVESGTSGQFAVWSEAGEVSVLNGRAIRQGRVEINRVIEDMGVKRIVELNEVDDSFLQIVGEEQVDIAEINIGKVMTTIPELGSTVIASKCLRRMTLFAVKDKGLVSLTL